METSKDHSYIENEGKCNYCKKIVNELILCEITNDNYCLNCSIKCFNCDEYTCKKCTKKCKICKQYLCLECIEKVICWSCINRLEAFNKQCHICRNQLEEELKKCFNCGLNVCESCSNKYNSNVYCKDCRN